MLVLGRTVGEVIRIGDNIRITVLGVDGHRVKLGFEAPENVLVDRLEIAESRRSKLLKR